MTWSLKLNTVQNFSVIENFFTNYECEKIIELLNKNEKYKAIDTKGLNERESNVSAFLPNNDTYWIYEKMTFGVNHLNNNYFNFDLTGFNEPLQFLEYESPNGHYDNHLDIQLNASVRKLSVILQLSNEDSYKGGELELYTDGLTLTEYMSKKQGSLIAFPSYLLHKVNKITEGKRYSLIGWVTGPQFK